MTWIEQLQEARVTLTKLRQSIRGNSPSQMKMSIKLKQAIDILDAQITVEKQFI